MLNLFLDAKNNIQTEYCTYACLALKTGSHVDWLVYVYAGRHGDWLAHVHVERHADWLVHVHVERHADWLDTHQTVLNNPVCHATRHMYWFSATVYLARSLVQPVKDDS